MAKKLDFTKIPEYTKEYEIRIEANANAIITLGAKEWKKKRKGKSTMNEMEQKEMVRKLETLKVDDNG